MSIMAGTKRQLYLVLFLGLSCFLQAALSDDCINYSGEDDELDIILCVSRPDTVAVSENTSFVIYARSSYYDNFTNSTELTLDLNYEHEWVVDGPEQVTIVGSNKTTIVLTGATAGRTVVSFSCPNGTENTTCPLPEDYTKLVEREVAIVHSLPLNVIIDIVGWIYFLAWSISFYPQIFLNFKRRSVVGLNFDFLTLNITGFLAYAAFNVGLFWIPVIQQEYFERHPAGVNPVLLNDVIFALHAVFATSLTIFQCFIFERGGQRVSYSAMVLVAGFWLAIVIPLFVSVGGKLAWLDYLYVLSYVKLGITLVKYVPQAWLNCKRKSTEGWSIGNVLLDFTGGTFSVFQMFLLSYNYDDWNSIFGDPTKFGLGVFSIMFDILFICQHYVIFPERKRKKRGYKKIESLDEKTPLIKDEVIDDTVQVEGKGKGYKKLLGCLV